MRLGDIVTLQRGTTYKSGLSGQPGPVLLGLASIQRNGGFRDDNLKTYGGDSPEKLTLHPGDIYVSLKDVTQSADLLGAIARVPSSIAAGRVTQDTVKLTFVRKDIPSRYIYWLLRTPVYREYCRRHAIGTTNLSLSRDDFLAFPVPTPKVRELKLVEILDALDEKIEVNRRMNATLEAMARAMFQSWFVDFDPVRAKLDGRFPVGLDEATAALFPNSFQDSTTGHIPSGWRVMKAGEFIERLSVGQKYEQKTVSPIGKVPVLDQGKSGVIGFHNNEPGVTATLDKPVAVFANHTCYMRLITYSFSTIQNVLPFVGSGVDTLWAYYATEGRLSFSEYKGHWPDFVIQESVVPPRELTAAFGRLTKPLVAQMRNIEEQSRTLATIRDTLLPKLLSGELSLRPDHV